MSISSFIYKYYTHPIMIDSGYNFFNTLTYALLAIVILFGLYKFFIATKTQVNIKILYAIFPFIFFGAMTRAFVDHNYFTMTTLKKFLLITPGIWFISVAMGFIAFSIGHYIQKRNKIEAWRTTLALGLIPNLICIGLVIKQFSFDALASAAIILTIFTALCATIYLFSKHHNLHSFTNKMGFSAIAGQLWDGANTSTILYFHNAYEKHPLPRLLIEKFGAWSFLAIKLIVVLSAVYLIYKNVEDKTLKNTFLMGIAIFGFGEGLRNFISLILA